MRRDVRDRWVAALRSGEYRQGYGHLCRIGTDLGEGTTYCCLGVLADVLGVLRRAPYEPLGYVLGEDGETYAAVLPRNVHVEIELPDEHAQFLVSMNDSHTHDFDAIANYIEENM